MAIEVTLPGLGEGIESGDVLELLVKEGDTVKADQGLMEMETDKATVTLPSPAAGKIVKLLVAPGDTVAIGQVVAQLESAGSGAEAPAKPASPPQAPAEPPAAPQATNGSSQEKTPAAAQPAAAPTRPAAEPARQPSVAQPSPAVVQTPPHSPQIQTSAQLGHQDDGLAGEVPAGPAVRRFAREVGVDLSQVVGSGPGGRITRDDVLRSVRESSAARSNSSAQGVTAMTTTAPAAAPVASAAGGNKAISLPGDAGQDDYGPVRVERMSKIRKTIAAQMHKSWSTVPRVTNFDDADVTDLEAFRQQSKDDYAAQGIKLTTMPFLMKAVAMALRNNPLINATIDSENDQIIYRDYVNLGVAVDTDRGLVVPNIRHADALSIPAIAKALADLATRVRQGEFGVNELRGGTFTISNLGAIGGTYSTPIVNIPEVAILLVGRTRKLPVVMADDSIQAREMMPLSLSYDHRLVDGGTAARFLNDVIAYLEAPSRLLLAIS